ncbi:MAG: hypothetical protein UY81_C0032G0005 [Candidatus Giovannonibacteria bacterium GW2011_GWA2_53_7]|uniref:Uncharacterized protein n=1 Tax=Candidatus Giovannonibacteria bacterium GW2011_GWA2_53_7 TaxID=1618650 RepID=A0A0G2A592_9BACT|nr:MAG: hypothetical protein UY81_C0032G0005 [Candidatus Giovannonibacteria bacterium GW2011_GWA2_53_7]
MKTFFCLFTVLLTLTSFTSTATAATITLASSPSEISRGNPVSIRLTVKEAPPILLERLIWALLKKDNATVGWAIADVVLMGENGVYELTWNFSAYEDDTKIRVVEAGEGYSLLIGILPTRNMGNDFRLPSTVTAETFVASAETPRFAIKQNRSNLFIQKSDKYSDIVAYILGKEGKRYRLEETRDLRSWSSVLTPPNLDDKGGEEVIIEISDQGLGLINFMDSREMSGNRFFRAVLLGP